MKNNSFQYCIDFCHTSTWISHRYTYAPTLLNLLPLTSNSVPPPCLSQSSSWTSLSHTENFHWIYLTYVSMYASILLSSFIPPIRFTLSPSPQSPPHPRPCLFRVHKSVLYFCVSIAALQIGSSLPPFKDSCRRLWWKSCKRDNPLPKWWDLLTNTRKLQLSQEKRVNEVFFIFLSVGSFLFQKTQIMTKGAVFCCFFFFI